MQKKYWKNNYGQEEGGHLPRVSPSHATPLAVAVWISFLYSTGELVEPNHTQLWVPTGSLNGNSYCYLLLRQENTMTGRWVVTDFRSRSRRQRETIVTVHQNESASQLQTFMGGFYDLFKSSPTAHRIGVLLPSCLVTEIDQTAIFNNIHQLSNVCRKQIGRCFEIVI